MWIFKIIKKFEIRFKPNSKPKKFSKVLKILIILKYLKYLKGKENLDKYKKSL